VLTFQWNALRAGDKVLVHDPTSADLTLASGVVTMIDVRKGANSVGIRLAPHAGGEAVLWPSHLSVHLDPRDDTAPCWRCQARGRPPARAS